MDLFEWAQNNLAVETPEDLQAHGVNVYFAPHIRRGVKVVNLADGQVDWFAPEEAGPQRGYYVGLEELVRYCRENGCDLAQTDGRVTIGPAGPGEAADLVGQGAA